MRHDVLPLALWVLDQCYEALASADDNFGIFEDFESSDKLVYEAKESSGDLPQPMPQEGKNSHQAGLYREIT